MPSYMRWLFVLLFLFLLMQSIVAKKYTMEEINMTIGLFARIDIESLVAESNFNNNAILQIDIEPATLALSISTFASKIKYTITNYIYKIVGETGNASSFIKVTVTHQDPNRNHLKYILEINVKPSKEAFEIIETKLDTFIIQIEKDIVWEIIKKDDFKSQRVLYDVGRLRKQI